MNDLQKFKAVLSSMMGNTYQFGKIISHAGVDSYAESLEVIQGAINDNPNGTVEQCVASAEYFFNAHLGIPNQ